MHDIESSLTSELNDLRGAGLYRSLRCVASAQGPRITIDSRELLNFCSNDYLGLANHPCLKEAVRRATDRYGVGAGASRLMCGNLKPYAELENALAEFKRKEAAIVFSSGYAANVGTISALVGAGDVAIIDKLCHASIIDGCKQSGATLRVYPHGNLEKLESLLAQSQDARRRLIVTETIFSMDGDQAPLPGITDLKQRYDAWLMIDEAHGTGVFGEHGRGLAEQLGVENQVDVTMGTLSKAVGCLGGYVAGSRTLIDYLLNKARSLIYSTAMPPAILAAAAESVRLIAGDEGHARREQLWQNAAALKRGLGQLGIAVSTDGPILPVRVGDEAAAVELSQALFERGVFVSAIRYPTVAKGKARLRVTVTAAHRSEDIRRFLDVMKGLWKR